MLYTRTSDVTNYTHQHHNTWCCTAQHLQCVPYLHNFWQCERCWVLNVDFFVNNAITIFCLYVPREHTPETWQAPCFNNHILRIGINNHEQSSRTVNNHVWEHFCLSLLHFLGAAPRSCRGVSPLFSILLSTLLHLEPLFSSYSPFSILLFLSPIFHLTL